MQLMQLMFDCTEKKQKELSELITDRVHRADTAIVQVDARLSDIQISARDAGLLAERCVAEDPLVLDRGPRRDGRPIPPRLHPTLAVLLATVGTALYRSRLIRRDLGEGRRPRGTNQSVCHVEEDERAAGSGDRAGFTIHHYIGRGGHSVMLGGKVVGAHSIGIVVHRRRSTCVAEVPPPGSPAS